MPRVKLDAWLQHESAVAITAFDKTIVVQLQINFRVTQSPAAAVT